VCHFVRSSAAKEASPKSRIEILFVGGLPSFRRIAGGTAYRGASGSSGLLSLRFITCLMGVPM